MEGNVTFVVLAQRSSVRNDQRADLVLPFKKVGRENKIKIIMERKKVKSELTKAKMTSKRKKEEVQRISFGSTSTKKN